MDKETLTELRKTLEEEKVKLTERVNETTRGYSESQERSPDEIDCASAGTKKDLDIHLNNREAFYLKKVIQALNKIKEGTFGTCDRCEEEIDIKRLKARPTAGLCISCKEEEEKKESSMAEIDRKFNRMRLGG